MTFWVFFHWLKLKCSLIAKLILSSITSPNTYILPNSFFAGFINLTCRLFAKLYLGSFNVKKQLISMRFRISLLFKICLQAISIFFLIDFDKHMITWCDCIGKKFLIFFFAWSVGAYSMSFWQMLVFFGLLNCFDVFF